MYAELLTLVTVLADKAPEDEDVVAGPIAAALFVLLIGAVIFLGFSLVKRLRNAQRAEEAGLYDPSTKKKELPADWPTTEGPTDSKE